MATAAAMTPSSLAASALADSSDDDDDPIRFCGRLDASYEKSLTEIQDLLEAFQRQAATHPAAKRVVAAHERLYTAGAELNAKLESKRAAVAQASKERAHPSITGTAKSMKRSGEVHESLFKRQADAQERLEEKRRAKEQAELRELQAAPKINDASRRMVASRRGTKHGASTIAERAAEQQAALAAKQNKLRQALKEKEEAELRDKPAINSTSKRRRRTVDMMLQWEQKRQAKLDKKRKMLQDKELQALAAKPSVSKGSKRIVDKLKRKGARDEAPAGTRLYAQAEAMRQQQEDRRRAAENKHSHKPELSVHSANLHRRGDAATRLYNMAHRHRAKAEELAAVREELETMGYDPDTGQERFRPTINPRSAALAAASRRRDDRPVEDILLAKAATYEDRRRRAEARKAVKIDAMRQRRLVNEVSEELAQRHADRTHTTASERLQKPIGAVKSRVLEEVATQQPSFQPTISARSRALASKRNHTHAGGATPGGPDGGGSHGHGSTRGGNGSAAAGNTGTGRRLRGRRTTPAPLASSQQDRSRGWGWGWGWGRGKGRSQAQGNPRQRERAGRKTPRGVRDPSPIVSPRASSPGAGSVDGDSGDGSGSGSGSGGNLGVPTRPPPPPPPLLPGPQHRGSGSGVQPPPPPPANQQALQRRHRRGPSTDSEASGSAASSPAQQRKSGVATAPSSSRRAPPRSAKSRIPRRRTDTAPRSRVASTSRSGAAAPGVAGSGVGGGKSAKNGKSGSSSRPAVSRGSRGGGSAGGKGNSGGPSTTSTTTTTAGNHKRVTARRGATKTRRPRSRSRSRSRGHGGSRDRSSSQSRRAHRHTTDTAAAAGSVPATVARGGRPCGECGALSTGGGRATVCTSCDQPYHLRCVGLAGVPPAWRCHVCLFGGLRRGSVSVGVSASPASGDDAASDGDVAAPTTPVQSPDPLSVSQTIAAASAFLEQYSPPTGNAGNGDTDTRPQPRRDAHPADHAALVARAAEVALQPPPPPPPPHLPAHAYGRSGTAPTRSPRFDASSSAYEYDAPGLRSGSGDPASRTGRLITSASRVAGGRGGGASQLTGTTSTTAPAPAPARPSEQQGGGGEEGEQWIIYEGRRFLEKFRASQAATRHYFSGN